MMRKEGKTDRELLHKSSNRTAPRNKKSNNQKKLDEYTRGVKVNVNKSIVNPLGDFIAPKVTLPSGRLPPTSSPSYLRGTSKNRIVVANLLNRRLKRDQNVNSTDAKLMQLYVHSISPKLPHHGPIKVTRGISQFDPNNNEISLSRSMRGNVKFPWLFAHELYHTKDKNVTNVHKAMREETKDIDKIIKKHKINFKKTDNESAKFQYLYSRYHDEFSSEKRANAFGFAICNMYLSDLMRQHKMHPRARVIHRIVAPVRKSVRKLNG
jgi:hypothetical protein